MTSRPTDRRGLGRGLSALMGDALGLDGQTETPRSPDRVVSVDQLVPNHKQPRRHFSPQALEELAASIRAQGILQPILVRPLSETPGSYEIVAGERRWRAAQMAQLHEVPVLVREVSDSDLAEIALIENIQRADLNPLEEASAYASLMTEHGHTQERLGEILGKSRSHIANMLRLLELPQEVHGFLIDGRLSAGHARALVPLGQGAVAAARNVVEQGLSVRATEELARRLPGTSRSGARQKRAEKDPDTRLLEQDISAHLGMRVTIDHEGPGGRLTLRYRTLEELDGLCQTLTHSR